MTQKSSRHHHAVIHIHIYTHIYTHIHTHIHIHIHSDTYTSHIPHIHIHSYTYTHEDDKDSVAQRHTKILHLAREYSSVKRVICITNVTNVTNVPGV